MHFFHCTEGSKSVRRTSMDTKSNFTNKDFLHKIPGHSKFTIDNVCVINIDLFAFFLDNLLNWYVAMQSEDA